MLEVGIQQVMKVVLQAMLNKAGVEVLSFGRTELWDRRYITVVHNTFGLT